MGVGVYQFFHIVSDFIEATPHAQMFPSAINTCCPKKELITISNHFPLTLFLRYQSATSCEVAS